MTEPKLHSLTWAEVAQKADPEQQAENERRFAEEKQRRDRAWAEEEAARSLSLANAPLPPGRTSEERAELERQYLSYVDKAAQGDQTAIEWLALVAQQKAERDALLAEQKRTFDARVRRAVEVWLADSVQPPPGQRH